MLKHFQFLFLILFYLNAFGQQAKQYSFKHFTNAEGLASNTVRAITQDDLGYIWLATVNGLQRYDGNNFITLHHDEKNAASIPSDQIISFFRDRKGRLWLMGDNNRVGIFDTRKFRFSEVAVRSRETVPFMNLMELHSGELMLLQSGGKLFRYHEDRNLFLPENDRIPVPEKWHWNAIHWDGFSKKYWISCDSGLVQFDPAIRQLNYRGHNPGRDPVIESFKDVIKPLGVLTDGRGNLSFATWPYMAGQPTLYWYDHRKQKSYNRQFWKQLGYHETKGALVQKNGRFWLFGHAFFGVWDGGPELQLIPNEYRNEQSIRFDYAYHAYEDRENNIWIGTDNGLYVFNPDEQIFNTYNLARPQGKPMELVVQAAEETRDGKILVGCWGAGLFSFDQELKPADMPKGFTEKARSYSVWDISTNYKTRDIWIGQQGGLLSVYNQNGFVTEINHEIFEESTIRQIDEDTSGNMWFGTHNGRVIKWDIKKSGGDPRKGYELITVTGMVHKLHYDYQGYIYVATLGRGLVKIDARTNKVVHTFTSTGKEGERLFMNSPADMTYYNDTTLIVAAGCINVINTRTNKIRFYSTAEGLPSNTCQSVEKDEKGILWIGMLNGLCRLNLDRNVISYYDRRDGIAHDKFSMAGVKELSDGRLMFFTDHNFLVFNPGNFGQFKRPPDSKITGFKVAGHSLSIDSLLSAERAVLRYNNTSIGISFSALTYQQQRKLRYLYKLEGLDEEWKSSDKPMEVIYNYLPPGDYTFYVKTLNPDGMTSSKAASVKVLVRAPMWKTWWFYSLMALLAIAILYLLDRERMNKLRSLQQVRRQIRSNLRDEVSSTLNNINVLSEIAKIKADKNVEQSKDFIDQISEKSRYMMEAMEDVLWSLDPQNDSMRKTLVRIRELTENLRSTSGIPIDLIVDHKVEIMELGMKLRYELFFFYKEAINFIIEHIECGQVFVNFNKVKSRLLIEILCECGVPAEPFREPFRQALEKRVQELPATLEVIADQKSFAVVMYLEV